MIRNSTYTYQGVNQDISKSKNSPEFYFEGQHIKILSTDSQSTGSVYNEKGNLNILELPEITIHNNESWIQWGDIFQDAIYAPITNYTSGNEIDEQIASGQLPLTSNNQQIIGYATTRDGVILFTTDDEGVDCIWLLHNVLSSGYDLQLLYLRNLGFSTSNPIQAIFNFENENIQKVYWVDSKHQLRSLNITHNDIEGNELLIDIPSTSLNSIGAINFSQPVVTDIVGGGTHTSGRIQYAYNLYTLNGSQTKISPLSEMVSLDKGNNLGGGEVNEVVGMSPVVDISDIDQNYTHIKVYAIKYTSLNQIPSISLIEEREIDDGDITIYDDGSVIATLSLEEFTFLGSDPIVPKHIESKDNRLFLANIQTKEFLLPTELDCRAYSFPLNSTTTTIYDEIALNAEGEIDLVASESLTVDNTFVVFDNHNCINLQYDDFNRQYNSSVIGGTGKFIQYELVQKNSSQLEEDPKEYTFLKDDEIYRIAIQFYNNLGQVSLPKWIADFKTPSGNLSGNYNTLRVELLPEFYTWLSTYVFDSEENRPIGYKIIRANRTLSDRSILCQGTFTQMMCQTNLNPSNFNYWKVEENRREESDNLLKMPIPVSRGFESNISPIIQTDHLRMMNEEDQGPYSSTVGNNDDREFDAEEIFSAKSTDNKRQHSWQFTKLFQLNSPDVLFNTGLGFTTGLKFRIKGLVENTKNDIWEKRINTATNTAVSDDKDENTNNFVSISNIAFLGLFGPSKGDDRMVHDLIHRQYSNFVPSLSNNEFNIYGAPELTIRGQGPTTYNGDSLFRYTNSMEGLLTDKSDDDDEKTIISMNSFGNQCLTLVEGAEGLELSERKGLEDILSLSGVPATNGLLLSEIVIPNKLIYLGNMYGGTSFEDKKRTKYIEIGEYKDIATTFVQIDNAGDTYVYDYKFARITKGDNQILDDQVLQLTEIVNYPVETTVDLKNRNDQSLFEWDSDFQPRYEEYHQYNTVYSQQPTLVQNQDVDITFRRIKNFDTRIQTTSLKIPNENVDSWTNILLNEVEHLEGVYGPINNLIVHKDRMIAFQDEAIADISINPRIQVQGSDGVSIELGTGNVLYDYSYITTNSGTINKWSVLSTKKGIYYYDALNKAIGRVPDMTSNFLSEIKGLHHFFNNNYDYNFIQVDNPIRNSGVVFGYDSLNNDVYFTILQGDKSFTWCYNELVDRFVDLKTYKPSFYINKGEKLLLPNTALNRLYESYAGQYNIYFDQEQPSYITLLVNPSENTDSTFNNVLFKSEVSIDGVDQPNSTLTHIHAWNEYQDSTETELRSNRNLNLRRKFREWRAQIPRDNRDRIRNPWTYLKLKFENPDNKKLILHDTTVYYTV